MKPVTTSLVAVVCSAVLLLGAPHARAAKDEARRHYDLGVKAYNLQNWKDALEEFRGSYTESADPALLFNIGQCQRALRQYEAAEQSYRAFLRESKELSPATRRDVERLSALMQSAAAREKEDRQKPPTGVTMPPPEVQMTVTAPPAPKFIFVERPPAPPPKPWLSATGWTLTVGGVLLGATAAGLLGYGATLDGKITNAGSVATQESQQSDQQRYRIAGGITAGIGGACLVAAAVVFAVGTYRYKHAHAR